MRLRGVGQPAARVAAEPAIAVACDEAIQRIADERRHQHRQHDEPPRAAQPDAIEVVAYRLRKKIAGLGVELVALRGVGYLIREKRAE